MFKVFYTKRHQAIRKKQYKNSNNMPPNFNTIPINACDPATVHLFLQNSIKDEILVMIQNIDLDCINENSDTVLHSILRNNRLKETDIIVVLTSFLTQGVDPNIKNKLEETPLHLAVERRMKRVVDLLLKFNANIHTVDIHGNLISHFFIKDEFEKSKLSMIYPIMNTPENRQITEKCSSSFLKFLISKGIDFDYENGQGKSAVHLAIEYYLPRILTTLLLYTKINDKSALIQLLSKINSTTPKSDTAKYNSNFYVAECVRILLERSASLVENDCTLLSNAIKGKWESSIVQTILDYYLRNCNDKNSAESLLQELMSTCGLWSDLETDYFLTVSSDLIDLGMDFNCSTIRKKLLLTAMEAKNLRVLEFLKEHGVDFSVEFEHGKTLLHLLAEQTNCDTQSNVFFSNFFNFTNYDNYSVNAIDYDGKSALHTAAVSDNLPIARLLIELGADVNCKNINMRTPLHEALINDVSVEMVEILVTSDADLNTKDLEGKTALHLAVCNNNLTVVRLLIEHGAFVICEDANQRTPLHLVHGLPEKSVEIVESLVSNGADINAMDSDGETPLHLAVLHSNLLVIRSLIDLGANVNCKNKYQQTPLHHAALKHITAEIVELLLTNGAHVNFKDYLGNRPIHLVCNRLKSGGSCVLRVLLKNGAYVNVRNNLGNSALYIALSLDRNFMVYELLKYNANLNEPKVQQWLSIFYSNSLEDSMLSKHLIKLAVADLTMDREYKFVKSNTKITLIDRNYVIVDDEKYHTSCLKEIEKLKSIFLGNTKSLYDFLHMRPECRWAYTNHAKIQQLIKRPYLEEDLPIYLDVVLASYHEAVTRKSLLKSAKVVFCELIQDHLLSDGIDLILTYLADVDLISIIETNVEHDEDHDFEQISDYISEAD